MKKLSIITINLNNAQGLKKTIKSVVEQNSDNFEYIIIDGGSDDGSVDIIKENEKKIDYWVSEPDFGIYNAMNKGIKVSKGEYCQFLNSGDYLINSSVTNQMLEDNFNSPIIYGNMLKNINGVNYIDKGFNGRSITLLDLYTGTINHSCTYIKRELFSKYGFYDESLKIVSDWKFYLTVVGFHNEKVHYKDITVSKFDMQGISNKDKIKDKEERKFVLEKLLPQKAIIDYDYFANEGRVLKKVNNNKLFHLVVRLFYKFLLMIEKIRIKKTKIIRSF